ncbi:MAG TPA: glycosyltransferase [Chthoniobacterales bacterium]
MDSDTSTLAQSLGIGITTKDRWDDLADTLEELKKWGLDKCQIIVTDDGSDNPCPPEKQALYPFVKWQRFEKSQGLITQRNRLARTLTTDYYLSLDDDSFPVTGSLADAVNYFRTHPDVHTLALNMSDKRGGAPRIDASLPPFQSRQFVGCAVMHDRRKLIAIGGLREELKFYCEEADLSARMLEKGQKVVVFPSVVICHNRSKINRVSSLRSFQWARSKALLVIWTFPLAVMPLRLTLGVLGRIKESPENWLSTVQGFLKGLVDGFGALSKRTPMSMKTYREWHHSPWPPSC